MSYVNFRIAQGLIVNRDGENWRLESISQIIEVILKKKKLWAYKQMRTNQVLIFLCVK